MLFSINKKTNLLAGVLVTAVFAAGTQAGYAQSANASDDDYLSALTTMATDMDLDGLASQTFAPVTVEAPHLPTVATDTDVVSCETLMAQAKANGRDIEIFGDQAAIPANEAGALSKCMLAESGVLVSYFSPQS